jgi:hypothetical protein
VYFFFFRFFQEKDEIRIFRTPRERERGKSHVAAIGAVEREEERFKSFFFFFFLFSVVLFSVGFKRTNRQRREKGKGELEKQKQTLLPDSSDKKKTKGNEETNSNDIASARRNNKEWGKATRTIFSPRKRWRTGKR